MNNIGDYLENKAKELNMGRAEELSQAQKLLDEWYPGKCRAQSINNGILRIKVTSSSVANELRFKTTIIIKLINGVEKVFIR